MASVAKRTWTYKGVEKTAWVVRYIDIDQSHRSKQFNSKKDADKYRSQVEVELERGTHISVARTLTVDGLIGRYMEAAEARHQAGRRMGATHLKSLELRLKKHVSPTLGKLTLPELTFAIVDQWAQRLTTAEDASLSPTSAKGVMHMFKAMIDFAIRREWVHRNVVEQVMKDYRGGERKPIRTFDLDGIKALLAAVSERPVNHTARATRLIQCFVYVAAFSGLRLGEILALKEEDLDFETRVIHVRHNLTMLDLLKAPKTKAGVRDVPMTGATAALLADWIRHYAVKDGRGLIFRTKQGGRWALPGFYRNYWEPALARAGLGEPDDQGRTFHFHALRHFCASALIDAGLSMPEVASLMGHSAFDVTLQVYAHPIVGGSKRKDTVDLLSAALEHPVIAQTLRMSSETKQNQLVTV